MKRNTFAVLFSLLLIASCVLASCNANQKIFDEPSSDGGSSAAAEYDSVIRDLETRLLELQQGQYISDSKNQQEIERLQTLLAELKKAQESTGDPTQPPASDSTETPDADDKNQNTASSKFLYTVNDGTATVTGYTGNEETLIIPSAIDGYTVTAIADNAFEGSAFKSIVVSSGIVKIGWFCFRNCEELRSVILPASVGSIGYSAFGGASEHLTVYAPSGSFALQYAQSYGLGNATV